MLAQLEVKEIKTRTFQLAVLEYFFPIQVLSRIFKARGHPGIN
jgi:hypothetical protein